MRINFATSYTINEGFNDNPWSKKGKTESEFIHLFMKAFGLTAVLASAALMITESAKLYP